MLSFPAFLPALRRSRPVQNPAYHTREAFSQLYEATYQDVFRYVMGRTGQQHDAEDITAETYMKAWKKRRHFKGHHDAAVGWLITIARHCIIDRGRKIQRHPRQITLLESLETHQATPEQMLIAQEQHTLLWALLDTLPDERRELLILRYMLGWQVKRIADHMQLQPNTVSVTLRRSLQHLHTQWLIERGHHD